MNIYDYIIISIVAVLFIAAVIYIIKRRKSGKNFCCGDCGKCGLCVVKKGENNEK